MQRFALQLVLPALALFGLTAALSSFAAHTHRARKAFVGSVGLVASVSMYTSPMVAAVSIYRSPNPLPPADFPLYFTASAGTKISGWSPTTPVDRYCMQKRVIATKSVEFMPFSLSLFSFLSSALWMAYGLLGRDLFIAVSRKTIWVVWSCRFRLLACF
jgi:solute carrier family 50 (sugar transporter)